MSYKLFFSEVYELAEFIMDVKQRGLEIICQSENDKKISSACVAAILEFFECKGMSIFTNKCYTPSLLVYHKIFNALWSHSELRRRIMKMKKEQVLDFMHSSEWNGLCLIFIK